MVKRKKSGRTTSNGPGPGGAGKKEGPKHANDAGSRANGGAAASGAGRAELHESRAEDGAMRMVPVAVLPLAPGESASFEPGGLHLMLKDLERMPAPGETVRLCLITDDGEPSCADAAVRRDAPAAGHHHEH